MTNRQSFVLTAICTGVLLALAPLSLLRVQGVEAVGDVDPQIETSSCVELTVNMRYRSTDAQTGGQVSLLQDFLQSRNFLTSEPTGFFGILTLQAVKNFQMSVSISPTGYVGPITRAKIKDLTCGGGTNQPSITVLSPNGGERLRVGAVHPVSWTYTSLDSGAIVSLQLVLGGNVIQTIKPNILASDKIYNWTVPDLDGENGGYRIKITCTQACPSTPITDSSDGTFIITTQSTTSSITVLSPNGGETYMNTQGSEIKFRWQQTGGSYVAAFLMFPDNALCYMGQTVASTGSISFFPYNSSNNGFPCNTSLFPIDRKIVPGQYKLLTKLFGPDGVTSTVLAQDQSDSSFTITASTTPTPSSAYFKFDETSGQTLLDSEGTSNGYLGASSAVDFSDPSRTVGRINGGLLFDGSSDLATVVPSPSLENLTSFTYSAWINPTGWGGTKFGRIISKESSAGFDGNYLYLDGPGATLGMSMGNGASSDSTANYNSLQLNTWQQVAVTYNNATDRTPHLYINGKEVTYVNQKVLSTTLAPSSRPFIIGNRVVGDRNFQGTIDEVRIYNRALTAAEIQARYNSDTATAQPQITILSPNGGDTWQIGNTYTIQWNVTGQLATRTVHLKGSINGVAVDKYLGATDGNQLSYTVSSLTSPPGQYTLFVCGGYCDGISSSGTSIIITAPTVTPMTDAEIIQNLSLAVMKNLCAVITANCDSNFDLNNDGRIGSADSLIAGRVLVLTYSEFDATYKKIIAAIDSRIGLKTGDAKFLSEFDANRNGTIDSDDRSRISHAMIGTRIYLTYTLEPGKTYFFKLPGGAQLLTNLDLYTKNGEGFVKGSDGSSADQILNPQNGVTISYATYFNKNTSFLGGTGWRNVSDLFTAATSTSNQYIIIKKLAAGGRTTEWVPPSGTVYYSEGVSSDFAKSWLADFQKDYPAPSANRPPAFKDTPTGPTSVNAGQQGTWTFHGGDPDGMSLIYTASWGDNTVGDSGIKTVSPNTSSTFTFTHTYQTAGAYTITFGLKDSEGAQVTTTKTVEVVTPSAVVPTTLLISGGTASHLRDDFSGWVGFQFKVGSVPIMVSQLGRYVVSGSSGTHIVKLLKNDGTDVSGGSVTVNTAGVSAGAYAYSSLTSPITLQAGTTYGLVSQEFADGADQWYDDGGNAITTTADVTPTSSAWARENTAVFYLANIAGESFGPVNLKYTKNAVALSSRSVVLEFPEPSSISNKSFTSLLVSSAIEGARFILRAVSLAVYGR